MLEFIQAILNVVAKAVPAAIGKRHDKRLGGIGAELFLFYVQVNEALICAEDIISSLETYVSRMGDHIEHGNDSYALTVGHWIEYKIERQCANLARIGQTMKRWGRPLQIIDGESFAEVAALLSGKANALDTLLKTMRAMKLPLSVTLEELEAFGHNMRHADFREEFTKKGEFADAIRGNSIPLQASWDQEVYQVVVSYLRDRDPRQQVARIRMALEEIKSSLEKNFSLADVIMRVGDERFRTEYNGDFFW